MTHKGLQLQLDLTKGADYFVVACVIVQALLQFSTINLNSLRWEF